MIPKEPNGNEDSYSIFTDTEDFKNIQEDEVSKFVTVFTDGLTFAEGVQERQDAAIRTNVIFNSDIWPTINEGPFGILKRLMNIEIVDEYLIFHVELLDQMMSDPILSNRIKSIFEDMSNMKFESKNDELTK